MKNVRRLCYACLALCALWACDYAKSPLPARRDNVPIAGTRPLAGSNSTAGSFSFAGTSAPAAGNGGVLIADAGATPPSPTGGIAALISQNNIEVSNLTLGCKQPCADLEVLAYGGHPPYTFAWEDGTKDAKRHVCPSMDSVYRVTVSDTAIETPEFGIAASTIERSVQVKVVGCPTEDAGVQEAKDAAPPAETCTDGVASGKSWELMPDMFGMPSFFAEGADLPAGRYRIDYVDGCIRFDPLIYFWTVHGFVTFEYVVFRESTANLIGLAPGVVSLFGYGVFEDCITANKAVEPLLVDHPGGKLGIWNNDFMPSDNTAGEGNRNPKWRLSRVCE